MVEEKMKPKIAHFISDSGSRDRQMLYELIVQAIKHKVNLHFFILGGNNHFISFLKKENIEFTELNFKPNSFIQIIIEAFTLSKQLKKFDGVHTHYHDANLLGLLSAKFAGIKLRVSTRHHNSFNKKQFGRKNYNVKRLINKLSTKIIAPSKTVWGTLRNIENVHVSKISIIHHPFDLKYLKLPTDKSIQEIKSKYNIPSNTFVIGAVSSLFRIKGTQYILDAFIELKKTVPDSFLIIANAHGELEENFRQQIEESSLSKVLLIPFENDILSLYKVFDIIVHVPISMDSEAFGQVYTESMIMGVPGIFTKAGVLNEIAEDNCNCLVVDYMNKEQIIHRIIELQSNAALRKTVSLNAQRIKEKFDIPTFRNKLLKLYRTSSN